MATKKSLQKCNTVHLSLLKYQNELLEYLQSCQIANAFLFQCKAISSFPKNRMNFCCYFYVKAKCRNLILYLMYPNTFFLYSRVLG